MIVLSPLDAHVMQIEFCKETVASNLASIREGDVMFSTNLKSAYFRIPIHQESKIYFWFVLKGPQGPLLRSFNSIQGLHTTVSMGPSAGDLIIKIP